MKLKTNMKNILAFNILCLQSPWFFPCIFRSKEPAIANQSLKLQDKDSNSKISTVTIVNTKDNQNDPLQLQSRNSSFGQFISESQTIESSKTPSSIASQDSVFLQYIESHLNSPFVYHVSSSNSGLLPSNSESINLTHESTAYKLVRALNNFIKKFYKN